MPERRTSARKRFQFLGIPPKGEHALRTRKVPDEVIKEFPISRDPPEGGTKLLQDHGVSAAMGYCFQFLGIPPKGELTRCRE